MARALFVYGTLQDQDMLFAVLGRPLPSSAMIEAVAPNHRAALYPGRPYPALTLAPGRKAPGLLLYNLAPRDMARLDAFEGADYQRSIVAVESGHATQIADVYWPAVAIGADAPDWRIEHWRRNDKARMLDEAAAAP